MARSTISQALRDMRSLHQTDAGRLYGVNLRFGTTLPHQGLAATPQPWRERIQAGIDARHAGLVTDQTPEYLVFSDGVLILVLTAAAQLLLPDYPLTPVQARHQTAAAAALSDLRRHILTDLADRATRRSSNDVDGRPRPGEDREPPVGWLRVAPTTDATHATWVDPGTEWTAARRMLARVCHTAPDQVLILDARGYGAYGRNQHRHRLDVLCAMRQIAATHQVALHVVGDWLDTEGVTTTDDLDPAVVVEEFTATYLGAYPTRSAYTQQRMRELGWTQAVAAAGIPDHYLDTAAITRHWFTTQVREVTTDGGIAVFTRHPHQLGHPTRPPAPTTAPGGDSRRPAPLG